MRLMRWENVQSTNKVHKCHKISDLMTDSCVDFRMRLELCCSQKRQLLDNIYKEAGAPLERHACASSPANL